MAGTTSHYGFNYLTAGDSVGSAKLPANAQQIDDTIFLRQQNETQLAGELYEMPVLGQNGVSYFGRPLETVAAWHWRDAGEQNWVPNGLATTQTSASTISSASGYAYASGHLLYYGTSQTFSTYLSPPEITSASAIPSGGSMPAFTWTYQVTAKTSVGETTGSQTVQVTTTASNSSVQLYWTPVANATSYTVYRTKSTSNSAIVTLASNLTSASYLDTTATAPGTSGPPTSNTAGVPNATFYLRAYGKLSDARRYWSTTASSIGVPLATVTTNASGNIASVTDNRPLTFILSGVTLTNSSATFNSLTVTGNTSLNTLSASGAATLSSLTVTGNATLNQWTIGPSGGYERIVPTTVETGLIGQNSGGNWLSGAFSNAFYLQSNAFTSPFSSSVGQHGNNKTTGALIVWTTNGGALLRGFTNASWSPAIGLVGSTGLPDSSTGTSARAGVEIVVGKNSSGNQVALASNENILAIRNNSGSPSTVYIFKADGTLYLTRSIASGTGLGTAGRSILEGNANLTRFHIRANSGAGYSIAIMADSVGSWSSRVSVGEFDASNNWTEKWVFTSGGGTNDWLIPNGQETGMLGQAISNNWLASAFTREIYFQFKDSTGNPFTQNLGLYGNTNTLGHIRPATTSGTLTFTAFGWSSRTDALTTIGNVQTPDSTTATSSKGVLSFYANKLSSGSAVQLAASENMMTITNSNTSPLTRFIFKGDGSLYADVGYQTYDEYDDVALLRAIDLERSRDSIRSTFDDYVRYNKETLETLGIAKINTDDGEDGSVFLNLTKVSQLTIGAIWQLHKRLAALEQKLLQARN